MNKTTERMRPIWFRRLEHRIDELADILAASEEPLSATAIHAIDESRLEVYADEIQSAHECLRDAYSRVVTASKIPHSPVIISISDLDDRQVDDARDVARREALDKALHFSAMADDRLSAIIKEIRRRKRTEEEVEVAENPLFICQSEQMATRLRSRLIHSPAMSVLLPPFVAAASMPLAERISRNDELIFEAACDKYDVIASLMDFGEESPSATFARLEHETQKQLEQENPLLLLLSALTLAHRLIVRMQQGTQVVLADEREVCLQLPEPHAPSVPCYEMFHSVSGVATKLSALVDVIQAQDAQLSTLKRELQHHQNTPK